MSKYLRHEPEALGLTLQPGGWTPLDDLLAGAQKIGFSISEEELRTVVRTCEKKRFSICEEDRLIRANQGHSTEVDLQLTPTAPPDVLYHGTIEASLDNIFKSGLQKMQRHHVHLSVTEETARRVGGRRGRAVILKIDSRKMAENGHLFFVSENGVWLTDRVPAAYLTRL